MNLIVGGKSGSECLNRGRAEQWIAVKGRRAGPCLDLQRARLKSVPVVNVYSQQSGRHSSELLPATSVLVNKQT